MQLCSPRAFVLPALLLLSCMASCMWRRHHMVMSELPSGAASLGAGVEVLAEVEGYANFTQVLTLFATGTHRGTHGLLLGAEARPPSGGAFEIPVLDPVVRRVWALLLGTTRIAETQRVAMGRAMQAALDLGADTLVAPRFDIETHSLTGLVPLGFLFSKGSVKVHAKAVRLPRATATEPELASPPSRDER